MKQPTTKISIVFFTLILLVSCKQDPPPNFHFEYFGLAQGRYVVYDVVEVTHDAALGQHDTTTYQLKTVWGDVYIDNEGREGREFFRYTRPTSSDPWYLKDLWHGVYDGIRGELVEENNRVVKLVFAPTYAKVWDANAYNLEDELECFYRDIHGDTILNNAELDSTLVVEQERYSNLIDTVYKYEMYAKHIGLVYKHFRDTHYQFGSTEVNNGTELYYTFVTAGHE